jgi:hypothetical protein
MLVPYQAAIEYLRGEAAAFGGRAAIVGKGPSATEFDAVAAARDRFVVGLNEVSLRIPCRAAFVIDEDILDRHSTELASRDLAALIVPRVLHRPRNVGGLALYSPQEPQATAPRWEAGFDNRVYRFNLSTAPAEAELGETVQAYNFSAPTLAHLLAAAGFRDIQLAGVDGGTRYASHFGEFEYKKLKSTQESFDVQFSDLRQVRDRFRVDFSSVRFETATVLIGAEPEQCLATEVLKWSIDSRTFLTVRYVEPGQVARELYAEGQAGTPFSFQRIFLPRLAGHRGRGIYFDSDMLVMRDVYELFNWEMGGNVLLGCQPTPGRAPQYSVFLVENRLADWDPDSLLRAYREKRMTYAELIGQFSFAVPRASTLPREWNSLEHFEPDRTCNLHYTDMGTQPWLSIYNRNADVWCEALLAAARERVTVREALERSQANGWVRPSLGWQVEHGHHDPWGLPAKVKRLDGDWMPPHVLARSGQSPRRLDMWRWQISSRMRRAMQSNTYRRFVLARAALRKVLSRDRQTARSRVR